MKSQGPTPEEDFVSGYYEIPDDEKLKVMSFSELASERSSCVPESPKFIVIDREMKKYYAKDQAKINRVNFIMGACIGGVFGLAGVYIGYSLDTPPFAKLEIQTNSEQQIGSDNLTQESQISHLDQPVIKSSVTIHGTANNPIPEKNNRNPINELNHK